MLDFFFTEVDSDLIRKKYQNIYSVLSGGDDLFLIGPWESIFKFSAELREKLKKYVCENPDLTISVGVALCRPETPIYEMADLGEEALSKAKEKKNSTVIFDRRIEDGRFSLEYLLEKADFFEGLLRGKKISMKPIADEALAEVLPLLKPGIRERDLAAELSYRMRLKGAERDAFDPIVASGRRSVLPHGTASLKKIDCGEWVVIDFGAVYQGYTSDMTRTVVVGKATPEMRKVYETVREAQAKAIDAARPGITCHALDQIARDYISQAGYGRFFIHSLGHGLGLHVHSEPRVGAGSNVVLEENFVITIEPGIYIPDLGGVRIEDDVRIQKDGASRLTHFSRELLEIE
jgi:hypothetical protein